MNTPMPFDVMLQVAAVHQHELHRDAEQRRLAALVQNDRPSVVAQLRAMFRREQPSVSTVADTVEVAVVDPYKTQPVKVIRRTEELRRIVYENIRQGNALQELEEQGEHQWQVGGA
jgi:hypothetical protein